ncbi:MAG: DUF1826 domain-containing protein [Pseudomonadota bacterium]
MTYVRKTVENAAIGVAVLDGPTDFSPINRPGAAAAIWRRQPPAGFTEWIDNLPVNNLPSARTIIGVENVQHAVQAICENAQMPDTRERRFLISDVSILAEKFAKLMQTQFLRLRFDVVQDNACRKFHIDSVVARLVCTYRGLGTQYGISVDGYEPKRVFSVPTGSPMVLKGTEWPEPPMSGLLHRSPQIEGTGMTRLVLVLDPATEPVPESRQTVH